MDNITMIAAVGKNLELGKNNQLIWPIKDDLKFFREQTMGKPIVMGMNTYKSLPSLLPGRKHVVLTSREIVLPNEVLVLHSIKEILTFIKEYEDEVMIIGGASLYKQFLEYAKKLILTEIDKEDSEADTFFPEFNKVDWNKELLSVHEKDNMSYQHVIYRKK